MELTKHKLTLEGYGDEGDELILRTLREQRGNVIASISISMDYIELTISDIQLLRDALEDILSEDLVRTIKEVKDAAGLSGG